MRCARLGYSFVAARPVAKTSFGALGRAPPIAHQPLPHWHILFSVALFFGIGAVLSIAFNKNGDLAQAIVIGISAPAIITNIINGASSDSGYFIKPYYPERTTFNQPKLPTLG